MLGSKCRMKIKKEKRACRSRIPLKEALDRIRDFPLIRIKEPRTKKLDRTVNRTRMINTKISVGMRSHSSNRKVRTTAIYIRIQAIKRHESRIKQHRTRISRTKKAYSRHIPSSNMAISRPRASTMKTSRLIKWVRMTSAINDSRQVKIHMKRNRKVFN